MNTHMTHFSAIRFAALAIATVAALGTTAPAHAAGYRLWVQHAQEKVYRNTLAPTTNTIAGGPVRNALSLSAAQGEHEGRQVVIRPSAVAVRDIWIEPSTLVARDASGNVIGTISSQDVETFKVEYVTITRPSTGYSRKGPQPDPLIPMRLANGERLGWLPSGGFTPGYRQAGSYVTQPFYVLFKVPASAPAGVYRGNLTVTASGVDGSAVPTVVVPVTLEVYGFSVEARTLPTAFGIGLNWARYANAPTHNWLPVDTTPARDRVYEHDSLQYDQISRWYQYLDDHRLSPQTSLPAWYRSGGAPGATGTMTARRPYLDDYLTTAASEVRRGEQGFGFNTIRMPEWQYKPGFMTDPFASSSNTAKAASYLSSMRTALGAAGAAKAYAYPVDEPPASKKTFIERYAALVHRYAPGVKFLLTTDGSRWNYRPLAGVDIYVQRLQYYYMEYWKWVAPLRRAGKQVWIYSHATRLQAQVPAYILDKPLGEVRSMGYFAYQTKAGGLLYYNINRWCLSHDLYRYRDPYKNTLSYQAGTTTYANGDGSLVYPGYYPAYGLHVQGAGPVGSLRMEALRDGLEDYEYLKQVERRKGTATANIMVSKILGPKATVYVSGKPTFPAYYKGSYLYERNHVGMASLLR